MDKLRNVSFSFEFVHIVGESAKPLWTAVSEQIVKLRDTYKKPLFAICEAPQWEMDESIDAFVQRLIEARKGLSNYDLQIVSAWSKYRKMDGRTKVVTMQGLSAGCMLWRSHSIYRRDEELQHSRNEDVGAAARRY
ncbi:DUF2586 family protein [Paenibacillus melissococcoides]|uniref:DUF2586 family protein n=1 Tax=Paenibacillus melissococcoides TaxID=2912268 RepID=UPI0021C2A4F2|nr:DUF2586 family protein [Paenibacillus melissococcoides]CAH8722001.1 DUF2586 family protein [Paenibacillus melissococcoides]